MKLADSPGFLLITTGALLGLTLPLGKLAGNAGVSPVVWAWLISTGSAVGLLAICGIRRLRLPLQLSALRYYLILGAISLVIPNLLIFMAIPKLGSGYTGLMFTLSPVITLTLSAIWQVRVPGGLGLLGIALGFLGAVLVAVSRGELGSPASLLWVLLGLCIPLSLAFGNLYRTMAWPDQAHPMSLAAGTNVAACLLLSMMIGLDSNANLPGGLMEHAGLSLLAAAAATAMFTVFFRLQKVGGPTYLSQIGYVAAGVALLCGTVFLSERYGPATWAGAALILAGIGISVRAQQAVTER